MCEKKLGVFYCSPNGSFSNGIRRVHLILQFQENMTEDLVILMMCHKQENPKMSKKRMIQSLSPSDFIPMIKVLEQKLMRNTPLKTHDYINSFESMTCTWSSLHFCLETEQKKSDVFSAVTSLQSCSFVSQGLSLFSQQKGKISSNCVFITYQNDYIHKRGSGKQNLCSLTVLIGSRPADI